MNIEVGLGVVGVADQSWGTTAEGNPVLLIRTAQATVRMVFTPEEAREHGSIAIYLAVASRLAAPTPGAAGPRPASILVGSDGGPIQ